jgi:hypothetical protein
MTAGNLERCVVASVGKFIVVWNLKQIEQVDHKCYSVSRLVKICRCYKKVQLDQEVVNVQFLHSNSSRTQAFTNALELNGIPS